MTGVGKSGLKISLTISSILSSVAVGVIFWRLCLPFILGGKPSGDFVFWLSFVSAPSFIGLVGSNCLRLRDEHAVILPRVVDRILEKLLQVFNSRYFWITVGLILALLVILFRKS